MDGFIPVVCAGLLGAVFITAALFVQYQKRVPTRSEPTLEPSVALPISPGLVGSNSSENHSVAANKINRFDSDISSLQRRHCVPLMRWMNAVEVSSPILFVSAQFGADEAGVLLPRADQQCDAAFANLKRALACAGRKMSDLVKLTIYIVHGRCSLAEYRAVESQYLSQDALPAVTIFFVPVRKPFQLNQTLNDLTIRSIIRPLQRRTFLSK